LKKFKVQSYKFKTRRAERRAADSARASGKTGFEL
jgi:hypothetical protein